jgi:acetylornithine deacetylase
MGVGLPDVDLLARLVAFDTTSRNSNVPMADFLCGYAERRGVRIERHPSPDGAKVNLVLRFGPEGAGGRGGLVLSGHMDVVPAEEPEWETDPFALADGGDRVFGRGTCDMKGFLAVALNVALEARDLREPLVLLFSYDEEVGTIGARDLVRNGPLVATLPKSVLVGEPTELRVVRMHKGHLKLRITLRGESAHSGYPHLGRNAIEAAGRVIAALRGVRHALEQAGGPNREFFPDVPYAPLNIGTIRGGSAVNVVPDCCVLELGVRLLPGMVKDGVVALLYEKVAAAAGADPFEVETQAESPPMLLDPGARVHRELLRLTGQPEGAAVCYATDAGWLATKGMECAIFGPGSIEVAHRANEFVPKSDLAAARRVLEGAVQAFCS